MKTSWPADVPRHPISVLASDLKDEFRDDLAPQLTIETLAHTIRRRFEWPTPVTFHDVEEALSLRGVVFEPVKAPPRKLGAAWTSERDGLRIRYNANSPPNRLTFTLLHELYESLATYLRAFDVAPLGDRPSRYLLEYMANRFAAAVLLPPPFVRSFVLEHGFNPTLLASDAHTSHDCAARRLVELLSGRPTLRSFPDDLEKPLLEAPISFFTATLAVISSPDDPVSAQSRCLRCRHQARDPALSLRRNSRGARSYEIPRRRELWAPGELLASVLAHRTNTLVERVTGTDLFGERDLIALVVPREWHGKLWLRVYATPPTDLTRSLWGIVAAAIGARTVPTAPGLLGSILRAAPRKPSRPRGMLIDTRTGQSPSGPVETEVYSRPKPRSTSPTQRSLAFPDS